MNQTFNLDEIFEMAEQIERNGAKFYAKAAEHTKLTSSKGLLLKLADMEAEHEKTFAKLRRRFSRKEWQTAATQPDDEAALYIRALADGYVFNVNDNPLDTLNGSQTMHNILRLAVKLEENSIIFYLGLKDITPQNFGRDLIEKIIKEEQAHIVMLSRELANL